MKSAQASGNGKDMAHKIYQSETSFSKNLTVILSHSYNDNRSSRTTIKVNQVTRCHRGSPLIDRINQSRAQPFRKNEKNKFATCVWAAIPAKFANKAVAILSPIGHCQRIYGVLR